MKKDALKALLPGKGRVIGLLGGGALVAIDDNSLVFVPKHLVDARFVWRAEVVFKYTSRETKRASDAPFVAVEILTVYRPSELPKSAEVLCYVVGYDYKQGGGKLRFVGEHPLEELKSVRFKNEVIKDFVTANGAAFKATIKVTARGLQVRSMKTDENIVAMVEALRRKASAETGSSINEPLIVTGEGQTVVPGAIPAAHAAVVPVLGNMDWDD